MDEAKFIENHAYDNDPEFTDWEYVEVGERKEESEPVNWKRSLRANDTNDSTT